MVTRTYLSRLELGKNPTLKVLASIAYHFNISLSELLSGVNNK
ncbi:MAG: helix-turn-helix transcriptional regulator, partial [Burkholderiaceae bacterium]|nr:helix-turn-helix transcriptional regulator [Burkholderiaceae bacterium]